MLKCINFDDICDTISSDHFIFLLLFFRYSFFELSLLVQNNDRLSHIDP